MATEKILGSSETVETSVRKEYGDREATVIEVEGLYSYLEQNRSSIVDDSVPNGLTVETISLSSTSDGMGKITIRCVKYQTGSDFNPERTTFRIEMQEVTYDLEDHPAIDEDRDIILKWLATDVNKRCKEGSYYYTDDNGSLVEITERDVYAEMFITAYMSGIKTFNRYFPVIEKISVWKNPPGISMNGKSYTGGSMSKFSDNIGTYNDPPFSLNGYPSKHWFKSKDSWVNNSDKTWTRTEQWTYTPESSSGLNAWIYTDLY